MKNFLYRLKWWLFQNNKGCKSCCLFCKHYRTCFIDVTAEQIAIVLDEFDKEYNKLHLTAKEKKACLSNAVATGIAKALEK